MNGYVAYLQPNTIPLKYKIYAEGGMFPRLSVTSKTSITKNNYLFAGLITACQKELKKTKQ